MRSANVRLNWRGKIYIKKLRKKKKKTQYLNRDISAFFEKLKEKIEK